MHLTSGIIDIGRSKPRAVLAFLLLFCVGATFLCLDQRLRADPILLLDRGTDARQAAEHAREAYHLVDPVILGISNDSDPAGVLNQSTLSKAATLSTKIRELLIEAQLTDPAFQVLAPDSAKRIVPNGLGKISLSPLFPAQQRTEAQLPSLDDIAKVPLLRESLISADGRMLAITIPLPPTPQGDAIAGKLRQLLRELPSGADRYSLTGYPLGRAITSARPNERLLLALIAGLLLSSTTGWLLLRCGPRLAAGPLIASLPAPLLVLALNQLWPDTQTTLSVIPPLAAVVSGQLCSWSLVFSERTSPGRNWFPDLVPSVGERWQGPALTLPLAVIALCLLPALMPSPSIRQYALLNALAVVLAWFCSHLVMLMWLSLHAARIEQANRPETPSPAVSNVSIVIRRVVSRPLPWLIAGGSTALVGMIGCLLLSFNDPPATRTIMPGRGADQEPSQAWLESLGRQTGLLFTGQTDSQDGRMAAAWLSAQLSDQFTGSEPVLGQMLQDIQEGNALETEDDLAAFLSDRWTLALGRTATGDHQAQEAWSLGLDLLVQLADGSRIFLRPEVVTYMEAVERILKQQPEVEQTQSLVSVVKEVHQNLFEGAPSRYSIPATAGAVRQTLDQFTAAAGPAAMARLVAPDHGEALIRFSLRHDDRKTIHRLRTEVEEAVRHIPPPTAMEYHWVGTPMVNTAWQDALAGRMWLLVGLQVLVVAAGMTLYFRPSPTLSALASLWPAVPVIAIFGTCGFFSQGMTAAKMLLLPMITALSVFGTACFLRCVGHERHGQEDLGLPAAAEHACAILLQVMTPAAFALLPFAFTALDPLNRTGGLFMVALFVVAMTTPPAISAAAAILEPRLAAEFNRLSLPGSKPMEPPGPRDGDPPQANPPTDNQAESIPSQ